MTYILALDQGTTSSRAILFDAGGRLVGTAQREFRQHFPQPGWVEHDAGEIWETQIGVAREVLAAQRIGAGEVAAIGITNQRETTVLWDRASGRPLAPAIVWQDRRTADDCARLRAAGAEAAVTAATGLLLDPYFSATKLAWLLDHIPDARRRAHAGELAFGTIDSWLAWQLTDGAHHVTDASNAARTLLFDIHRGDWSDEMLALFDIPRALLPRVVPSSGVVGECAAHWLGAAVPLAGIAGDQQAATFGNACHAPGMAKNTYGTGCFMLLNTGAAAVASRHRLLTTVAWSLPDDDVVKRRVTTTVVSSPTLTYALEGSVFMAGAIVQWLRDGLGIIGSAGDVEALAASVPDSGGVVLVPAFAGLGAPWWDADARATLSGMTRGTTRAHIARAALEAIVCQNADVLDAMQKDAGIALAELRVDGGAAGNDMLMQMQADILGVPVLRPRLTETTALGAASLAGLAVGLWRSVDDLAAHWQLDRRFEPQASTAQRDALLSRWRAAVEHTRRWPAGV